MPLDVLIATPSGPFGELIRLTLEAEPAFHCTLIDKGEDIRAAIRTTSFKAVVYDCSFSQPGPEEIAQIIRTEDQSPALLFIPSESNPDMVHLISTLADGTISRPFEADLLPELIRNAIQKRHDSPTPIESSSSIISEQSHVKTLQEAIVETSASSGLIIQNGAVLSATAEIKDPLQSLAVSAIIHYWNHADTSDLLRYIKDPETNQEWMMYATQIAGPKVLALLYVPQTPVTKVRIQTVQLARKFSTIQISSTPDLQLDEDALEYQEPPKLREILGESNVEIKPNTVSSFPVEWFKEIDLPKPTVISGKNEEPKPEPVIIKSQNESEMVEDEIVEFDYQTSDLMESPKNVVVNPFDFKDFEPLTQNEDIPVDSPQSDSLNKEFAAELLEIPDVEKKTSVSLSETSPVELDLGSFQPVDLIAESPAAAGLDSLQPVTLNSVILPTVPEDIQTSIENEGTESDTPFEISEFANLPYSETGYSDKLPENAEQTREDNWPDFQLGGSEIVAEQDLSSENNALPTNVLDDLTDIPDFENLPFFLSKQAKELPVDDYGTDTTGDMESALSPSGLYDLQPNGEPVMENIFSDEEQNIDQTGLTSDVDSGIEKNEMPDSGIKSDLFARMNQLQTAAKNEGTETITIALIPRQESFIIQRQIAGLLNQCMNRLSQAFGWKLENLTIRPTYMQYTMTIPNLFSPEDMVGIVRKQTTQFLNENIPDLQLPADTEDIWAPESMMATGKEFVPSNHWQNFIIRRKNSEIA